MPLARIEIEQVEADRWVAEVEAGGQPGAPPFRRRTVSAQTPAAILAAVAAVYYEQAPAAAPAAAPAVEQPRKGK